MAEAGEVKFIKQEKGPLDKFKNEKLLKSKFGDVGIDVYRKIDEDKTAEEMLSELSIGEGQFVEILEFMESNNMVKIIPLELEEQKVGAPEIEAAEKEPGMPEEIPEIKEEIPEITSAELPTSIKREEISNMSSLEKMINDKFGEVGLQVYNLIDGERTAEEILNETGISEVELVEILEFMDKEGIIKLEKPEETAEMAQPEVVPAGSEGDFEKIEAAEFQPIIEERSKQSAMEEEEAPDIIPIDLPMPQKGAFINDVSFKVRAMLKFGKLGTLVYGKIDGKKTIVELVTETDLSFQQIDSILLYAGQANAIYFQTLSKQDIKTRYGEDGLRIYNKFGRDGILIYSLIGKEASLKDIVSASKLEPEKVVEIFLFIHNILEIGLPLSKEILYKQLGLSTVSS